MVEYERARISYGNDETVGPMDVATNDFKNVFEFNYKVVIDNNCIDPLTEKEREIMKKAVVEHRPVKLRGSLSVAAEGKTIEEVKKNWDRRGFSFWLDSVEE